MGFIEILTIVLVILKASGHLDWSWWLVFAPELAVATIYTVLAIGGLVFGVHLLKRD